MNECNCLEQTSFAQLASIAFNPFRGIAPVRPYIERPNNPIQAPLYFAANDSGLNANYIRLFNLDVGPQNGQGLDVI